MDDKEKIHDITSLLTRRVVGEASRKNLRGSVVVEFNKEADTAILALIGPEQIRKEERGRIAKRIREGLRLLPHLSDANAEVNNINGFISGVIQALQEGIMEYPYITPRPMGGTDGEPEPRERRCPFVKDKIPCQQKRWCIECEVYLNRKETKK